MDARATALARGRADRRRLAAGFVAAVAISAGLIAVRAGATLPDVAGIVGGGALVGAGLLVVLGERR